ncbi:MAG: hypothetical protein ACMZI0_11060 [Symbiopectobacterium sp.]|uniref:hypothetical protein n=1 Tax=Symbiopectobacterium sp. TaxID=2952789 RepID=UPI0039ED267E
MPTDLLADVLGQNILSSRKLSLSTMQPDMALLFPCERSIGIHMVVHGPVYLHSATLPSALRVERGDIVVMARGVN